MLMLIGCFLVAVVWTLCEAIEDYDKKNKRK